jgi:hypothetical protein
MQVRPIAAVTVMRRMPACYAFGKNLTLNSRRHCHRCCCCREAEAAEARAQEEADRRLQQTDPKASIAWKKGGEHRVRQTSTGRQVPSLDSACTCCSKPAELVHSGASISVFCSPGVIVTRCDCNSNNPDQTQAWVHLTYAHVTVCCCCRSA